MLRRIKTLEHKGWQAGIGQVIGVVSILTTIILFFLTQTTTNWLYLTLAIYCAIAMSITVGYHRLFAHQSFTVKKSFKWLEKLMGIFGIISWSGSTLQWCVAHNAHHKYSDTDKDPHNVKNLKSAWLINYVYPKYNFKVAKHLLKDKFHLFLHNYYWGINLLIFLCLLAIDWKLAFFGYILPAGLVIIMGGVHNVVAHWGNGIKKYPLNIWWYAPFSFGEWLHKNHHDFPGRWNFSTKWYEPDLGALFIKMIKSN